MEKSLLASINSILPSQLMGYLTEQGWREDGAIENIASVWHREEQEYLEFEIIQPTRVDLKDYKERVADLVGTLARFENRSVQTVLEDLLNFYADIIKIRVVHNDVEGGSIPLSDGVSLFEHAKDLLTSVAKSTFSKRKYFFGQSSQDVNDIVNKFRLGQTEVGSYIVNLIIPIECGIGDQQDHSEVSITRSVSHTLARSLLAIEASIDQYKSTRKDIVFDSAVQHGVSANLCDALVGLTGEAHIRNVEIKLSLSRGDKEFLDIPLSYSFNSSEVPFLQRASDYYKDKYVIQGYTVSGYVRSLKHEEGDDFGTVSVSSLVNEKERNVTFELPTDQYWEAHHAHKAGLIVECTGHLSVSPRSATVINPSNFKVIRSQGLFD